MGEDFVLNVLPYNGTFKGFGDVLRKLVSRVYDQMTGWNVRMGEQLSIVFSCLDKPIFNILNSLINVYYLVLICLYAFKWKATHGKLLWGLGASFVVVLNFQPALGEIFFWRTGSANYLWALCLLLTFALPMRYYLSRESMDIISGSRIRLVGLTVLGFFAGFTNENTVGAIVLLYAGMILCQKLQKRKLPTWVYISFCSLSAGFLFMLKAPSTAFRTAFYNQMFGITNPGIRLYLSRIPTVILRFFKDNRNMVGLTIGCLLLGFLFWKRTENTPGKKESRCIHLEPLGWLLLTSLSCGALIISPYIETRAFLFSDFMMNVCIVYYSYLAISSLRKQSLLWLVEATILVLSIPCAVGIYDTYRKYGAFCDQRIAAVELCEEKPFVWGEYASLDPSRILTTREEYCHDKSENLSWYFQKDIRVVPYYIWKDNLRLDGYTRIEDHGGGMDWADYDQGTNVVTMGGWLALPDTCAEETEIYTYLDVGDRRWYYATRSEIRPDVAEALDNADLAASGFRGEMQLPEDTMEFQEVELGAVIVDRSERRFCEISCGTMALN